MAPEILKKEKNNDRNMPYDETIDVFSLGMTMFFVFTKKNCSLRSSEIIEGHRPDISDLDDPIKDLIISYDNLFF